MKAQSTKQRMLVTLHAFFKHSDADHLINQEALKQHLEPYHINSTAGALRDTVRIMRNHGMDVRFKDGWGPRGYWLEGGAIPSPALEKLVFAVTTNPHLSGEQAVEILQCLKPFVTVYQEEVLAGYIETAADVESDDALYDVYHVIFEAIRQNRKVVYTSYFQRSKKAAKELRAAPFIPKGIYRTRDGELYMVGYHSVKRRFVAVNMKDIVEIRPSYLYQQERGKRIHEQWEKMNLNELVCGKGMK